MLSSYIVNFMIIAIGKKILDNFILMVGVKLWIKSIFDLGENFCIISLTFNYSIRLLLYQLILKTYLILFLLNGSCLSFYMLWLTKLLSSSLICNLYCRLWKRLLITSLWTFSFYILFLISIVDIVTFVFYATVTSY